MILRAQKPQVLLLAATAVLASVAAQAAVTISTGATKNIVCSAGVCTPTHKSAVLNARDLQTMLGTGNVTITTGSGSLAAQTSNIAVASGVTWTSGNALTLDAYESVTINAAISVAGTGGVSLTTNDGGTGGLLSFGPKGNVVFGSLTSSLTINGVAYTLVANIATLASDIAANASGNYALAANYNAAGDGIYTSSPITTTFNGTFEGLGNTISQLSVRGPARVADSIGLFEEVGGSGMVANLRLTAIHMSGSTNATVGGLAALSDGLLFNDSTSGTVEQHGTNGILGGGLVGINNGTIGNSHSTANTEGGSGLVGGNAGAILNSYASGAVSGGQAGGLASYNFGSINSSYATGAITNENGFGANGGLVGENGGSISDCYATGALETNTGASVGGLVGDNSGTISYSYSTGPVARGEGSFGGFVGDDQTAGDLTETYWDTTTSGITLLSDGAGNRANDPGITGLTTTQLQSALPAGFDPAVWGQSPSINGGLPYLLANPPP